MAKRFLICCIFVSTLSFNIGVAADARLAGMGNLILIFQDDFNRLDLYDFADMSAGLLRNDSLSSCVLRASGLKESWEIDSLSYLAIGQAIPQKLIEYAPVEAVAFYEVIPQFKLVPCEFIYTSARNEEGYDYFGNLSRPQSYRISVGYSQLSRDDENVDGSDIVRTPSFAIVYAKQLSNAFDVGLSGDMFYGVYNTSDRRDEVSLVPIGGALGISYNTSSVNLGLNAEYHYPIFTYTHTMLSGNEYSEHFSGHAFSPSVGSVVNLGEITWASAVDYKWINLGGSDEGGPTGDLEINGYAVKTQVLYMPSSIRATGFAQYNYKKPVYTDEGHEDPWFEVAYKDYILGGGIGAIQNKIKIGAEGFYKNATVDDKVHEEIVKSGEITVKCGAEFDLPIKNLLLRGGYNYSRFDPDTDDTLDTDDRSSVNTLTTGLGINVFKNTRIDIAYNYKWIEDNLVPDEKVTDHIILIYFKHVLKSEQY